MRNNSKINEKNMGNCLEISNSFSILALLMRLSTLKHKKMKKMVKTMSIAEKECVLLFHNYEPNPIMEVMFGEKCYNWKNPKDRMSISMDDVAKTIRFTEIQHINDEKKLTGFITSKLNK
jgi:hypothetical protein